MISPGSFFFFFQLPSASCRAPVDTLQSDFVLSPLPSFSRPATHTPTPSPPHPQPPDQHPDGADTHIPVVSSCFCTSRFLTNVGADRADGDVEEDAALY